MLSTPLHPLLVHFPIGLLIFGVIAQIVAIWKKPFFDQLALFLFSSGFIMGVFAYISGDGAEHFARNQGQNIHGIVHTHETYALITLFIFGAVVLMKWLSKFNILPALLPIVIILSLAGTVTLALTGHYGGKMVYHPESAANPTHQTE